MDARIPARRLTAFLGAATAALGVASAQAQPPARLPDVLPRTPAPIVPLDPPMPMPTAVPAPMPKAAESKWPDVKLPDVKAPEAAEAGKGPEERKPAPIVPLGNAKPDEPCPPDPCPPAACPVVCPPLPHVSAAARAPGMMGDLFGVRAARVNFATSFRATFPGVVPTVDGNGRTTVLVNPNAAGASLAFGPTPNGTVRTVTAPFTNTDLTFAQPTAGAAVVDADFARTALRTLLSTGRLTAAQAAQLDKLTPADRMRLLAARGGLNAAVTRGTGGVAVADVDVGPVTAALAGTTLGYATTVSGSTVLALPGAAFGRIKASEDNGVLPRDRVIFDYDVYDKVPLTANGLTVNRFQAGIEKTFLDGTWSAEVRLPFASTLASTTVQGNEFRDVELGNLRLAAKKLWTDSDVFNFSTGLALTLPTAPDQVALSPLGGELYRFRNESVTLEPFAAALFTPNDRLFVQAWSSVNFDTSGGRLRYNTDLFGGNGETRVYDSPLLAVDAQVGYWLVKNDTGRLRGLAPFAEMHYNQALDRGRILGGVGGAAAGSGLSVTAIGDSELNITGGVVVQLGDNTSLTFGVGFPLLQAPDRTFDAQYGLRFNYLFGKSGRAYAAPNSF